MPGMDGVKRGPGRWEDMGFVGPGAVKVFGRRRSGLPALDGRRAGGEVVGKWRQRGPVYVEYKEAQKEVPRGGGVERFQRLREILSERVQISDVVGGKVELRQSGSRLVGCCPFHEEKTGSFTVFEDTNSYFCFGCREHGDVIKFVMKTENLSFSESVRLLGKKYNLVEQIQPFVSQKASVEQLRAEQEEASYKEVLYHIVECASELYSEVLWSDARSSVLAREYMYKRGFSEETLRTFKIGLGPNHDHMLKYLSEDKGFKVEDIVQAGVLMASQKGTLDPMKGRIVITICDARGRPIAFGGRKLYKDDWGPKYLNSRETPIFKKSETLFGEHLLPRPREPATAVIVEGYLDVMKLHQEGLPWAVSSLGTGLTYEQITRASRHSRERAVTINLDNDAAGEAAISSACKSLFKKAMYEGIDVRVTFLPEEYKDQDELLEEESIKFYVRQVLSESQSWFLWYTRAIAAQVKNIEGLSAMLKVLGELLAESIPPRREGTGFVVKEYARTMAKQLADIFERPEYEQETAKEIIRTFWVKRTGGKFEPRMSIDERYERDGSPAVKNNYNGGDERRSNYNQRFGNGKQGLAKNMPLYTQVVSAAPNDLYIDKSELTLLRVIIQDPDLRKKCYEAVESRAIKFHTEDHTRLYQWLVENIVDEDEGEIFEDLAFDQPVGNLHRYFFKFPSIINLEGEMNKSLTAMQIYRMLKMIEALDYMITSKMHSNWTNEDRIELHNRYETRKHLQQEIDTLRKDLTRMHLDESD